MTLRMRTLIAGGTAVLVLLLMGVVLLVQYTLTASVSSALQETLSPTVDASASLTLEQANAGGALSDYIMLDRGASLDAYRQSIGKATTILDEIEKTLPESAPDLAAKLLATRAAQKEWINVDAQPAIKLMDAGKRTKAMKATNSEASWASYEAMTNASNEFHLAVNTARNDAADVVNGFTKLLGITMLVIGLLLALGLAAFLFGLQQWVLVPLSQVREDLQRAARTKGHESPIAEVGPPELRAVAGDAEYLRRGLVKEIDEARAAREGLAQDAPLVAAMQAEMTTPGSVDFPGLAIAGIMQSAEGVIAGDWWDAIPATDGTLAVIVADVSGHGPEASVTAIRIRSVLRAGLLAGLSPDRVFDMAAVACADDSHFVTAIVLVIDPVANTITWCNAGHHPAIVVTRDKEAHLCQPTGPLISTLGGDWSTASIDFHPGDALIAFTDGLVESRDVDGDELESTKVAQFIRGLDAPVRENPEELITRLLAQVRHRAADWRKDDVTLVAVSRRR